MMNSSPNNELDLFDNAKAVLSNHPGHVSLVLELEHRAWLRFLSDEWLIDSEAGQILLGVNHAYGEAVAAERMSVGVWFDREKLPAEDVLVWRETAWKKLPLSQISASDTVVIWLGPLPLSAAARFTVKSNETRSHLLAMARNFGDMEFPTQPVEVAVLQRTKAPVVERTEPGKHPPKNWDALRGAGAMALWAVPAIGPWLDVLCEWLSGKEARNAASILHAPWLEAALWSKYATHQGPQNALWPAIVDQFSESGLLTKWQPRRMLEAVHASAKKFGENGERLKRLVDSTTALLLDRGTIQEMGLKDDLLCLSFQLVLMRPTPERFAQWKEDWPAVPPGAWWTGALLSGYLSGFRALPLQFRGSAPNRRFTALRTWQATDDKSPETWASIALGSPTWLVKNDMVELRANHELLSEYKFSNRGRWHLADLTDPAVEAQALLLAEKFCPERLRHVLTLENETLKFSTGGGVELDLKHAALNVKGKVDFFLPANARTRLEFDADNFRDWLATASISYPLPRPLNASVPNEQAIDQTLSSAKLTAIQTKKTDKKKKVSAKPSLSSVEKPEGLLIVPDFITSDHEFNLIELIDAVPWDASMSRRVQHHGWRYDYKARKVDEAAYLGSLPDWATALGEKLLAKGFVTEMPDQVLINEYVGAQGISKHIDCPSCFRGPVVTISLNESWEMTFTRAGSAGSTDRYKVILPRRSATVLDGDARSNWLHEIPKRLKESGVVRGRRLSITFRKVDNKKPK